MYIDEASRVLQGMGMLLLKVETALYYLLGE